jgi:hypothetical protein
MSISMCEFQQCVLTSGTGRHAWQMGGPAPQRLAAFAAFASILRHPAHGIISARGNQHAHGEGAGTQTAEAVHRMLLSKCVSQSPRPRFARRLRLFVQIPGRKTPEARQAFVYSSPACREASVRSFGGQ